MGKIEVLHPLSFKDDPTRIFRAIRFSERFSFEIEARTKSLMMEALAEGDLSNISRQRIRDEFILTLEESDPFKPIERLSKLNLLKYAHPELRINSNTEELYKQILSYYFQFGLVLFDKVIVRWLPFFLGLLEHLNFSQTEEVLKTLNFPKALRNKVLSCKLKDDDVVSILKRPHKLPPSVIHQKLKGFSTEALLFLAAKAEVMMVDAKSDLVKKRLSQFLQDLRRAKVSITGHDLKRIGFKPGPVYKKIIDALLLGRLDGLIKSREDELRCVEEFKQRL
jgi:tRNA nucleotidyltransferase (CCA-adding enzyme)